MENRGTNRANRTLDCTGLGCPTPVLRLRATMDSMEGGEVLELLTTDPGAKADVSAWCRKANHEILQIEEMDGAFRFYIRKSV